MWQDQAWLSQHWLQLFTLDKCLAVTALLHCLAWMNVWLSQHLLHCLAWMNVWLSQHLLHCLAWMNVWLSQHLLQGVGLAECLAEVSLRMVFRYEEERLPRVKTVYEKGKSAASAEDKEKYLYKPTFKPLWQQKVCHIARGLLGVPCCDTTAMHALGCCLPRLSS